MTIRTVSSRVKTIRLVSPIGSASMLPPAPDPARRNERSRRAILAAAIALIGELGYDQVSIEAIAKRAGVGKQTIYRWWPSKGAVVLEALDDSLATVVDFPDTGDIVEDLRTQMHGVTQLLGSTRDRAGLPGADRGGAIGPRALARAHRPGHRAGQRRVPRAARARGGARRVTRGRRHPDDDRPALRARSTTGCCCTPDRSSPSRSTPRSTSRSEAFASPFRAGAGCCRGG